METMRELGRASPGWLAELCEQPAMAAAPPTATSSAGRDGRMNRGFTIPDDTNAVLAEVRFGVRRAQAPGN
jgi:hypothetical protein